MIAHGSQKQRGCHSAGSRLSASLRASTPRSIDPLPPNGRIVAGHWPAHEGYWCIVHSLPLGAVNLSDPGGPGALAAHACEADRGSLWKRMSCQGRRERQG